MLLAYKIVFLHFDHLYLDQMPVFQPVLQVRWDLLARWEFLARWRFQEFYFDDELYRYCSQKITRKEFDDNLHSETNVWHQCLFKSQIWFWIFPSYALKVKNILHMYEVNHHNKSDSNLLSYIRNLKSAGFSNRFFNVK